jgi:hypothetical protein
MRANHGFFDFLPSLLPLSHSASNNPANPPSRQTLNPYYARALSFLPAATATIVVQTILEAARYPIAALDILSVYWGAG